MPPFLDFRQEVWVVKRYTLIYSPFYVIVLCVETLIPTLIEAADPKRLFIERNQLIPGEVSFGVDAVARRRLDHILLISAAARPDISIDDAMVGLKHRGLNPAIQTLGSIKRVEKIATSPHAEDDGFNESALKSFYLEYVGANPEGALNGTISKFSNFLDVYAASIKTACGDYGVSRITTYRSELINALDSRAIELVSEDSQQRLVEEMAKTPVLISDPITNLMITGLNGRHKGIFHYNTSSIFIDPHQILNAVDFVFPNLPDNKRSTAFDNFLRKTLYHEMFHSATDMVFSRGPLPTRVSQIWPQFIAEALAEKAGLSSAHALSANKLPKPPRKKGSYRNYYQYPSIPEELVDNELKGSNELSVSAYPGFRFLYDLVLARVDWRKAGLSPAEGRLLLRKAFFEGDGVGEGTSQDRHQNRKLFNAAISRAAHPGLIQKLGALDSLIGTEALLNILSDPDLDLSDPASIPWLVSPLKLRKILASKDKAIKLRNQIDRSDYSNTDELQSLRRQLKELEDGESQYRLLRAAARGLQYQIKRRHGVIAPEAGSPEFKMELEYYGNVKSKRKNITKRPPVDQQRDLDYLHDYLKKYVAPRHKSRSPQA